jgi:hypothetical protein
MVVEISNAVVEISNEVVEISNAVVEISNADDPLMKTVRFRKKFKIKKVPRLKDMSKDQIQATWYNEKDFAEMRKQISSDGRRLSTTLKDAIGAKKLRIQKRANIRKCQRVVLLEQERQWESAQDLPEVLAAIYTLYTQKSAIAAFDRGCIVAAQLNYEFPHQQSLETTNKIASKPGLCKIPQSINSTRALGMSSFHRSRNLSVALFTR